MVAGNFSRGKILGNYQFRHHSPKLNFVKIKFANQLKFTKIVPIQNYQSIFRHTLSTA